jgi:hypothetical protein
VRISQVIAGWDNFQLSNLIAVLGKCPRQGFTYLREGEKKDGHHSLLLVEVSYYYTTHPWIGKQGKGSLLSWTPRTISFYYRHSFAHVGPWVCVRLKVPKSKQASPPIVLLKAVHIFHISPFNLWPRRLLSTHVVRAPQFTQVDPSFLCIWLAWRFAGQRPCCLSYCRKALGGHGCMVVDFRASRELVS